MATNNNVNANSNNNDKPNRLILGLDFQTMGFITLLIVVILVFMFFTRT